MENFNRLQWKLAHHELATKLYSTRKNKQSTHQVSHMYSINAALVLLFNSTDKLKIVMKKKGLHRHKIHPENIQKPIKQTMSNQY